jgi:hypothetical protein
MVILAGHHSKTQFIEVVKINHSPNDNILMNGTELINIVYEKDFAKHIKKEDEKRKILQQ